MCIVFLVIYADVLVGSAPEYNGIIHDLMPQLTPNHWIVNRSLVVGLVVLTMLVPLSVQRDLQRLSGLALVGVGAVVAFATATIWLTVAAYQKGMLHHLPWLPNWDALTGTETADKNSSNDAGSSSHSWIAFIMGVTGVVPLLLNADICHQSIFPAMSLLQPYSRR
jgi:amino acid permease